ELENQIDEGAGTKRWIFIDDDELTDLFRSGWSAATDQGAALLREAIERDDLTIASRLIAAGAPLGGPSNSRLPSFVYAPSALMVDLLVRAGADPNERPVGRASARTPLMGTDYKDAAVADALLKAGARIEDEESGHTALFYAACVGNWRVVSVLLSA